MRINPLILIEGKQYQNNYDVEYDIEKYQTSYLRQLSKCHVDLSYRLYGELISIDIIVSGVATLACSYTLEDVDYVFEYKDSVLFSKNEGGEEDDIIVYKGNYVDIDDYVLTLICASLPTKIVKNGAKLPSSGDGYRVLSEEEYNLEKQKDKSSPFDILIDKK